MKPIFFLLAFVIVTTLITAVAEQQAQAVKQQHAVTNKLTPTERFRAGYQQGWADAGLNTGNFCDNNVHTQNYCDGYSQGYYAYQDQHRSKT